jgi:hypothetical protein
LFSKQLLPIVELRIWTNVFQQPVQTIHGEWHQGNAGGRRNKSTPLLTFYKNPAYLLTLSDTCSVQLILHQSFQTSVPLAQHHPIGIYVLSTTANVEEPSFVRARSVSKIVHLNAGEEYYVLPACFEANSFGKFELDVLCNVQFTIYPAEIKLPTPPPIENKTPTPPTTRKIVSTTRKPVTTTTATGIKQVSKRGNLSLATARLSTLTDDYSKKTIE